MRAFDVLKKFWDTVWLGFSLNEFITLKGCSNDHWKNQTPKILKIRKGTKNVRIPHILRTLSNLHIFGLLKIFWDIICLGCCLNSSVTLRWWSNDIRKKRNRKILKNSQGYEECEESSHSSYPPKSPLIWTF